MKYTEQQQIDPSSRLTSAVTFLLVINVAIFLLERWFPPLAFRRWFLLEAKWFETLSIGNLFTYMFVHANLTHLFFNMMTLFFIGPPVEKTIGSYRFFVLYYLSGILGGLGWSMLAPAGTSCIGASGAVMGVLGAFGALYPRAKLLLWFVIPVRAWVLVLFLALWEIKEMLGEPMLGGIANAAHLIGGVAGFCYAISLKRPDVVGDIKGAWSDLKKGKWRKRKGGKQPDAIPPEVMDAILDKIGKEGMGALTHQERQMLKRSIHR